MKLFDTHCHLNFKDFEKDYREVIERSRQAGVEMLVVGTDLATSQKAIELANKFEKVYAAVGFHPIHLENRSWKLEVGKIIKLAKNSQVKAIGEIGFDNYRLPKSAYGVALASQKEILDRFLSLAFKLKKPVVFHSRGWVDELAQEMRQNLNQLKQIGAVFHCFPGNLGLAKWLMRQGFYLGFNGMVTKNAKWNKVINQISLNNILLETDAPFLTPSCRGKVRNEPVFVKDVAEYIVRLKNIPLEDVAKRTYENSLRFLRLKT